MTARCPAPPDLTRLLDGELTENRAAEVREHVAACQACAMELEAQRGIVRRLAAPIPGLPSAGALDAIMSRLDGPAAPQPHASLGRRRLAVGGLAAAAAVAVALTAFRPDPGGDRGDFAARGTELAWSRKVGVELWALDGAPRRLAPGARLAPGIPVVGAFSNVDAAPAYLLAFALDARGDVHWLYPAYLDPGSDPESVRLDASVVQRVLSESVVMEGVATGPLRLVTVVTREPLRISAIESAAAADRALEALRGRWPDARVDELAVSFDGSRSATP